MQEIHSEDSWDAEEARQEIICPYCGAWNDDEKFENESIVSCRKCGQDFWLTFRTIYMFCTEKMDNEIVGDVPTKE